MIKYSIAMHGNPSNPEEPKKAYAVAQSTSVMSLDKFADHIAQHGSVYRRADVVAILLLAVDCLREQLLAGSRVEMGDLGSFYVTLNSTGADTAADFNPSEHIRRVRVNWDRGTMFTDLLLDAEFELVASRKVQAKVLKALKAGESVVDLTADTDDDASDDDTTGGSSSGGSDDSGTEDNPLV